MEEKKISYFQHEGIMARMERTQRRLWVVCLVALGLLAGSNIMWVIKFMK